MARRRGGSHRHTHRSVTHRTSRSAGSGNRRRVVKHSTHRSVSTHRGRKGTTTVHSTSRHRSVKGGNFSRRKAKRGTTGFGVRRPTRRHPLGAPTMRLIDAGPVGGAGGSTVPFTNVGPKLGGAVVGGINKVTQSVPSIAGR
jgi:hypothetical protein